MSATERLVLELPSDLAEALREPVRRGAFASEGEVLTALLRGWQGDDSIPGEDLESVRAFIAEGLADADVGRLVAADEMFERLRARYLAMVADQSE